MGTLWGQKGRATSPAAPPSGSGSRCSARKVGAPGGRPCPSGLGRDEAATPTGKGGPVSPEALCSETAWLRVGQAGHPELCFCREVSAAQDPGEEAGHCLTPAAEDSNFCWLAGTRCCPAGEARVGAERVGVHAVPIFVIASPNTKCDFWAKSSTEHNATAILQFQKSGTGEFENTAWATCFWGRLGLTAPWTRAPRTPTPCVLRGLPPPPGLPDSALARLLLLPPGVLGRSGSEGPAAVRRGGEGGLGAAEPGSGTLLGTSGTAACTGAGPFPPAE